MWTGLTTALTSSEALAGARPARLSDRLLHGLRGLVFGSSGAEAGVDARAGQAPAVAVAVDPGLLQAVIDRLPDAVLAVEGGRREGVSGLEVTLVNAAARRALPLPLAQGARLTAGLRHPDVLGAVEASAFHGERRSLSFVSGGSQPRDWRVSVEPLPAAEGRARALMVFQDETSTRRLERLRVDFLANASHELRTPLASLTGFIETLRGHAREDAAARDRFLAIMAGQADRMKRLIDDLLSLSRIELNAHLPPDTACDLSSIVREGADAAAPLLQPRGVRLDVLAAPPRLAVIADRDQLAQVVQNLIDNAAKYARAAVSITVAPSVTFEGAEALKLASTGVAGAHRLPLISPDRPHERRFALLSVVDDGYGIEREHLPRLAERFYRAPEQRTGQVPGTGLGLAIVKHIVSRHRGALVVEASPGAGAVFAVYLPLAEAGEAALDGGAVTELSPNRHARSASDVQDAGLEGALTDDRTHAAILRRRA